MPTPQQEARIIDQEVRLHMGDFVEQFSHRHLENEQIG
jgi:hypothetical protein